MIPPGRQHMRLFRAVALASTFAAAAAVGVAAQPVVGVRLGVGMSKPSTEATGFESLDKSWLTAFIGGGFIRFGAGNIALQPELMYVTRGVKFDDEATDSELSTSVDYLEIPVLLFLG